ncbi:hypothetical protein RZS08_46365, partial [Arthrospira platensis SPKY1]|nr:hypothetical protein [Arthrospira platensis SPKY1]
RLTGRFEGQGQAVGGGHLMQPGIAMQNEIAKECALRQAGVLGAGGEQFTDRRQRRFFGQEVDQIVRLQEAGRRGVERFASPKHRHQPGAVGQAQVAGRQPGHVPVGGQAIPRQH